MIGELLKFSVITRICKQNGPSSTFL